MRAAFQNIFEEHASTPGTVEQTLLQQGNVHAALLNLLIELVRQHERELEATRVSGGSSGLPVEIATAIRILHHNAHDPEAVRRIREISGLAPRRLNQQFVRHLGTTISQYWLRQRVRLAQEHLRTQLTVTQIAVALGFSSSQHFATVFRRITGQTPSAYRSAACTESASSRVCTPAQRGLLGLG